MGAHITESKIRRLKDLAIETKLEEPYPNGTFTDTLTAQIKVSGEGPRARPYRRNPADREIIRKLVEELIAKERVQVSNSLFSFRAQYT